MMNEVDYRMVAEVLREQGHELPQDGPDTLDSLAERLADRFEQANFYFNRTAFLRIIRS